MNKIFVINSNIDRIITICEKNNIPLVLGTLPINVKFIGSAKIGEGPERYSSEVDKYLERAFVYFENGKYKRAIKTAGKSKNTAMALRLIAECLSEQGSYGVANQVYKKYVQLLPMNRTRPSFNEYIRLVAGKNNVPLIDIEKYIQSVSTDGITDSKLFVDHCHMTWWGYKIVADFIFESMVRLALVPGPDKSLEYPDIDTLIKLNKWQSLYELPESKLPIILDDPLLGIINDL